MDYYANSSLGPWTVNNELNRPVRIRKTRTDADRKSIQNKSVKSNTPVTRDRDCFSKSDTVDGQTGSDADCSQKGDGITVMCDENCQQ